MEQSNHRARKKPQIEYTKDKGREQKRIAGILLKKKFAVTDGKMSMDMTRITPTASKDETIVRARRSIKP